MKKVKDIINCALICIIVFVGLWTCVMKTIDIIFAAVEWIEKKIRLRRRKAVSVHEEEVDE